MPARTNVDAVGAGAQMPLPPFPKLPEKLKKISPELEKWEQEMEEWRRKANVTIFGVPE